MSAPTGTRRPASSSGAQELEHAAEERWHVADARKGAAQDRNALPKHEPAGERIQEKARQARRRKQIPGPVKPPSRSDSGGPPGANQARVLWEAM